MAKKHEAKRPRGRPAHEPTSENRKKVKAYISFGVSKNDIALALGLDVETVNKYYKAELDIGHVEMISALAQTAVQLALGRPAKYDDAGRMIQVEIPPSEKMLSFVLDRRGGKAWQSPGPFRAMNIATANANAASAQGGKKDTLTIIQKGGLLNVPDGDPPPDEPK